MPERLAALVAALAVAGTLMLIPPGAAERPDEQDFSQVEQGRYLTAVADCAGCHTVPGQNEPFAGGGRPIETPFGIVVAPNITPDRETGIGAWSDAQFDAALRRGRGRDGARLYPAMPFPYYARMPRDDVLAIRAFLNTVAPVRNAVASDQLAFPLNIRAGMRAWDALYFRKGEFKPDAAKSAAWNRGAYLVEGPGHCGACHTPKTWLGGDESGQALMGYTIQGWFAPDITNDNLRGVGRWSVADIVDYLKTGHNRFAAASGPMGDEVALSSSRTTDGDLNAIAVYLKDKPGRPDTARPVAADDPFMVAGGAIYRDLCSACHKPDGGGIPHLFPTLAGSPFVSSREPTSLLRVVLQGARSVATPTEPTAPAMPGFGWQLTDEQVAAVTTYIRNSWGNAAPAVTTEAAHNARLD